VAADVLRWVTVPTPPKEDPDNLGASRDRVHTRMPVVPYAGNHVTNRYGGSFPV